MVPSIRVLIPKGSKGSVETPGPVTEAEHSAPRKDSAVTGSKNSPRMGTSGGNEYPFRLQGSQIDRERVRDGKRPATAFADDNDDADAHGLRQRSASSPVEKLIGYSRKPDDDGSRRSSLDGKLDNLKQQVKVQEEPICPPYAGPSDWDAKPRPYQV